MKQAVFATLLIFGALQPVQAEVKLSPVSRGGLKDLFSFVGRPILLEVSDSAAYEQQLREEVAKRNSGEDRFMEGTIEAVRVDGDAALVPVKALFFDQHNGSGVNPFSREHTLINLGEGSTAKTYVLPTTYLGSAPSIVLESGERTQSGDQKFKVLIESNVTGSTLCIGRGVKTANGEASIQTMDCSGIKLMPEWN